jgi:hypothetical protein
MSAKATGRMGYAARVTRRTVTVNSTAPIEEEARVAHEILNEGGSDFVGYLIEILRDAEGWLKAQGFDPKSGLRVSKRSNARRINLNSDEVPHEHARHREAYLLVGYIRPLVAVLDPKPLVIPPLDVSRRRKKRGKRLPLSVTVEVVSPPNLTLARWVAQTAWQAGRGWQGLQDTLRLSPVERDVGEDFRALVEEITRRRAAGEKVASSQWFAIMQKIQAGAGRTKLMTQTQFRSNLHKYRRKPGFEILKTKV